MTHLFILNAFAGTKDSTSILKAQIEALGLPDTVIEYTKGKDDATAIARRYAEKGDPLRVYACGGDGTANEAMHGLLGFDNVALGVVPVGTGNDYVRSLKGTPEDFLDLKKMTEGSTVTVDLLKCNDRYALNVISVGYDCEVADRAQKNKRLPMMSGSLAYKLAIVQCLVSKRKQTVQATFSDSLQRGKHDTETVFCKIHTGVHRANNLYFKVARIQKLPSASCDKQHTML